MQMIKKFIDKVCRKNDVPNSQEEIQDAIISGLLKGIEDKKKVDPWIGAKIAGMQIKNQLINALKTERGVHMDSLLCALGSLAGYSCQASLRTKAIEMGEPENISFSTVKTIDGEQYFFGDALNQALAESEYSVWSLASAGAQSAGCVDLPDITEMFRYVTRIIGSDSFGKLTVDLEHQPHHTPLEYLKIFWPGSLLILKQLHIDPSEWPIAFGIQIQDIILQGKDVINPDISLKIVMESAIQMSKIDLAAV